MKAAALCAHVDKVPEGSGRKAWIAMAGMLACCGYAGLACADADEERFADAALGAVPITATGESPLNLEIEASRPPRLDQPEGPFSTTRLDFTHWPHNASDNGRIGFALGLSIPRSAVLDPRFGQSVDVGVRWRSTLDSTRRIDVSAWRRVTPAPDAISMINTTQPGLYATRVEMQFTAGRSRGLVTELGAIGMQLESGAKLSLRTKYGKPMLYYRAQF